MPRIQRRLLGIWRIILRWKKVNHPSLEEHPQHELYQRYFPNGGGSIFTFDIKGGQREAHKFIDSLKIFSLLANVADVKSLVIHPATTTHSQLSDSELADQGIFQSTIRLSVGTENIDDIIEDLDNAIKAVQEDLINRSEQDQNIKQAS